MYRLGYLTMEHVSFSATNLTGTVAPVLFPPGPDYPSTSDGLYEKGESPSLDWRAHIKVYPLVTYSWNIWGS